MHKSLYSLMLMDSVVAEIDRLALQQNTNRSNLVNQILADYASMMTPEKRVNRIFHEIESLINAYNGGIVPFVAPNQMTMSLKSSLEYKYRPTIKYEVELYRTPSGHIGRLSVAYRSQSQTLITAMNQFFRLWKALEDSYLGGYYARENMEPAVYELYEGRFVRSIAVSRNRNYSNEQIGALISDYISMFDDLMKGYLSGRYSAAEVEELYVAYLNKGVGLI